MLLIHSSTVGRSGEDRFSDDGLSFRDNHVSLGSSAEKESGMVV